MAVLDGRNEWPDNELVDQPCFFCGQPVSPPAVSWRGCAEHDDPWLLLHPGCMLELFVRLARDVHEGGFPSFSEPLPYRLVQDAPAVVEALSCRDWSGTPV